MQFSENWLRTMVDPDMTTDELAHLMTMSGLEVEEVIPVAKPFSKIVVAEVIDVAKHPNADRLSVCQVDAGTGTILNIVCGAPNVRPGMKTGCALVGAVLPPGEDGKPFSIKKGKLRGVESNGMLCSFRELQLSEDHSGIMDLPEDAPVGSDLREYLQLEDSIFDIKLTPNKADCLSLLGVAREVSALTGTPLAFHEAAKAKVTSDARQEVNILAPDLCGRFSGRVIRNINAKAATPEWMKQRLERSGQRSVSALVDISNYVMLECGQPNHIYDLDRIAGPLNVRWGEKGETVELLNGMTVEVDDWVGVIVDENGVESLGGVMGGDRTAISLDTENIFIEAAFWWPDAIRGRARRFNFTTDAAHRFERGVDFARTVETIERITELVLQICGTEEKTVVGPVDDRIVNLPVRKPVMLRRFRAEKVIGIALNNEQIADIFSRLKLPFVQNGDEFTVTPPSYRFDIEIEEDLIEEIARVYGFENIPALPPVASNVMRIKPENFRSLFSVRQQMADLDYQEVVNYSFVEEAWEKDFAGNEDPIRLLNPIASQMSVMRSTMIGNLVANVRYNLNRKFSRIRLFEIGAVFLKNSEVKDGPASVAGYDQPKRLAAIACGLADEEQWGLPDRQVDFYDVKADLEALFAPVSLRFVKTSHPALHPGRCARLELNGREIGIIGELHPSWQHKYDLPHAPVLFEVDVSALCAVNVPVYQEISRYQPVIRDIALVVDSSMPVQEIIDRFYGEKDNNPLCHIMQAVVLFDDYRGKGLGVNEKSLAFRFTLQDINGTLQDEVVEAAISAFVAAVEKDLGARLRT
ncbi:phenylalanine--tRNA ligase subunit beta [Oxalobacter aliiformigenes]|uniref:phenylalanine--tRNA ligase subunit beta n=1 Tax=Oxalobacter aliiformigenes TaxID=2946593 RepID=UPI0022AE763E|nr:phenylalanine--tRNA ligase subunit beta [Oxalobacter aliiformigenes]MCZ4065098.1 phenylalanine--tRNA ligase subunit beta [Oxalobacter aliiformigenes]WAV99358.1 phenylalanine--tRNA ligase subunit beta [Oxalobacter aliiformigenes]